MTQNDMILEYLLRGHSLTPLDALRMFGCFRLGARILEIKRNGFCVSSRVIKKNGKRFSEYFLAPSGGGAGEGVPAPLGGG